MQHENGLASRRPRFGQRRVALVLAKSVVKLTWELSHPALLPQREHAEQSRVEGGSSGRCDVDEPGGGVMERQIERGCGLDAHQAGVGRHRHPGGVGPGDAGGAGARDHGSQALADLARGKLRKKLAALRQVLAGLFRPHHAFLVGQLLAHVDYLDEAITTVSEEVDARLVPFASQLSHMRTSHGGCWTAGRWHIAYCPDSGCQRPRAHESCGAEELGQCDRTHP